MTADVPVVEVVAVDAVLDALDTPTSSEVYSAVEPFSNSAVAAAAAARAIAGGGGGGSSPVSCVLARDNSFDVRTVGDHPILWDALYDNYSSFGVLLAIPAGLGLTFAFDGTDATITTTEAGVWAFTYTGITAPGDATWRGVLDTRFGPQSMPVAAAADFLAVTTLVLALPNGATFGPQVSTLAEATSGSYAFGAAYLIVTRLG